MPGVQLPVAAALASAFVAAPFPWLCRRLNLPALFLLAWLFALNLVIVVNTVAWRGNGHAPGNVWCNFATRFIVAGRIALPACCCAIAMELQQISLYGRTYAGIRRALARTTLEVVLCFQLPSGCAVLHFISYGNFFTLTKGSGCMPPPLDDALTIILLYSLPLCLSVLSLFIAALAFIQYRRQREAFWQYLANAISVDDFVRLLVAVWALMALTAIFSGASLVLAVDVIDKAPLPSGRLRPWAALLNWPTPIYSLFLGFILSCDNDEVSREYRYVLRRISRLLARCRRQRHHVTVSRSHRRDRLTTIDYDGFDWTLASPIIIVDPERGTPSSRPTSAAVANSSQSPHSARRDTLSPPPTIYQAAGRPERSRTTRSHCPQTIYQAAGRPGRSRMKRG